MCIMRIPEADISKLSKVLEIGSCVKTHLWLGDLHGFSACLFLSLFISQQVHLREEHDGSGAEGPLIFKQD